jgi:hypothetical protein
MQTQSTPTSRRVETNCPNCGSAWDIKSGLGICGYCGTLMPEPPPPYSHAYIPWGGSITVTSTGTLSHYYTGEIQCSEVVGPGYPQNNLEDPAILANRKYDHLREE